MAITRIPEIYRPGFAKIKKLSPADVEAISVALSKSSLTAGLRGMISTVSEQVPGLGGDTEDIVRALYSLYVYRRDFDDAPLPKFVSELIVAMRSSGKELALAEDEKAGFDSTMTRLLSINTLDVSSKAEQLRSDYALTFHDAKVLTDIRPVFARPEDKPIGVVIAQTLKIVYHERGEHKDFYVAMDAEDLQKMKKIIQRAEAKASSLKALIKTASLSDLSKEE